MASSGTPLSNVPPEAAVVCDNIGRTRVRCLPPIDPPSPPIRGWRRLRPSRVTWSPSRRTSTGRKLRSHQAPPDVQGRDCGRASASESPAMA